MTQGKAGDSLRGLSTRLFVLILAMVIAGFVIPSAGVSAVTPVVPQPSPSLFHDLATPSTPVKLVIPSLDLRAPIVPIQVVDHVLTPPSDPSIVGWWDSSAKPGADTGQTVITGHTVHTGGGVMDRLGELHDGARVQIVTPDGVLDYQTTRVAIYTKAQLAEHADELFNQERKSPRLVLITCTGWTGTDYTSNVVVFADPLGVRNLPLNQMTATSTS